MTTYYTDADRSGAGEFLEGEVWLATEFTIPDGTATFRWPWPAIAPSVTPQIRIFNASDTLVAGPISFDSSTLSAWNTAGAGSPIALAAGTYRVTVNTTRYPALAGFFSGGSITRGDITGVRSRFGSPGAAPASTSTATYYVDIDFTPTAGPIAAGAALAVTAAFGSAATASKPTAAALAVTASFAAGASRVASASAGLAVTATFTAGATTPGVSAALAVTAALAAGAARQAQPTAGLAVTATFAAGPVSARATGAALAVIASLIAAASSNGRITVRPFTGTTARPSSGITPRP